ncbi:MAG: hypothetical protein K0S51_1535 [Bacillales bacterium]|jgi:hypothetical protein|nr:hypothetical protein [Bacillales bacterium]
MKEIFFQKALMKPVISRTNDKHDIFLIPQNSNSENILYYKSYLNYYSMIILKEQEKNKKIFQEVLK